MGRHTCISLFFLLIMLMIQIPSQSAITSQTSQAIQPVDVVARMQKLDKFLSTLQDLLKNRMSSSKGGANGDRRNSMAESRMFLDFLLDPSMMVTILHSLEMAYWSLPFGFLLMPIINFFRVPNRRRAAMRTDSSLSTDSRLRPLALQTSLDSGRETELAYFLRNRFRLIQPRSPTPVLSMSPTDTLATVASAATSSLNSQQQMLLMKQLESLSKSPLVEQMRDKLLQMAKHPKQLQRMHARLMQALNAYRTFAAVNRRTQIQTTN